MVNAVKCALAIQTTMAERNAAIEPQRRMQFRVGINIGDVVYDEVRIYGDGINIAARLRERRRARRDLHLEQGLREKSTDASSLPAMSIGERQLKNIARPVHVYRIRLDGALASSRAPRLRCPKTIDSRAAVR